MTDTAQTINETASALVELESLQASREAVRQLTADNLKEKDAKIKEAKASLTAAVKGAGDHVSACSLCEHFAQGTPGDNGAARTATTRRRANLKKALESAFPGYDFAGVKAGGRYKFVASLADPAEEEFDKLLSAVYRLDELGLLDANEFKAANPDAAILAAIRESVQPAQHVTVPLGANEVIRNSGITASDLEAFDAKVSALRNRFAAQAVANQ